MSEYPKPKKDKRFYNGQPLIHTQSLMEIFDFDDHAIMTNERGFVTNRQKQKITDRLQDETDSMWLMVTIFLATAVLLALIFTMQGYAPLPLVIGVGLVIGGLLLVGYRRQQGLKQDNARLRTHRVDGVPLVLPTLSADKQAILKIGNKDLPISYQQAAALSEFALPMMRIYYASHSKQILSAEVLDNEEVLKLKNENLIEDEQMEVYAERQFDDEQSTMQK